MAFTSRKGEVLQGVDLALERAMVKIGMIAEGEAKRHCPVDTGRLRNSIAWVTHHTHGDLHLGGVNSQIGDSVPHGYAEKNSVAIGTNVEYALRQEIGDYKHRVGNKHFLRNAISENMDKYVKIVENELNSQKM